MKIYKAKYLCKKCNETTDYIQEILIDGNIGYVCKDCLRSLKLEERVWGHPRIDEGRIFPILSGEWSNE